MVCILLSSELSGTYNCATLAKEMTGYEKIYLVDSLTATCAVKVMADYACCLRDEGKTAEYIAGSIEQMKSRVKVLAALDTLEYLYRGGRLSKTAATIGEMANLKPVITLTEEGKVGILGKCLGINKAVSYVLKRLQEQEIDSSFPVYTIYSYGMENCSKMEDRLSKEGYTITERLQIGSTIGTHIGPEAFGVVYVEAE